MINGQAGSLLQCLRHPLMIQVKWWHNTPHHPQQNVYRFDALKTIATVTWSLQSSINSNHSLRGGWQWHTIHKMIGSPVFIRDIIPCAWPHDEARCESGRLLCWQDQSMHVRVNRQRTYWWVDAVDWLVQDCGKSEHLKYPHTFVAFQSVIYFLVEIVE